MGLLSWLGLKRRDDHTNLDELVEELRTALPDDEAVVIRYIAIVAVLLSRVARADGRFSQGEERTLRELLARVDRLSPVAIDAVCGTLEDGMSDLTARELDVCYRELKALCDREERLQILRLLVRLAAADGALSDAEKVEIRNIAQQIGLPSVDFEALATDASLGPIPADA